MQLFRFLISLFNPEINTTGITTVNITLLVDTRSLEEVVVEVMERKS